MATQNEPIPQVPVGVQPQPTYEKPSLQKAGQWQKLTAQIPSVCNPFIDPDCLD